MAANHKVGPKRAPGGQNEAVRWQLQFGGSLKFSRMPSPAVHICRTSRRYLAITALPSNNRFLDGRGFPNRYLSPKRYSAFPREDTPC
jgi:hypothetical protein